MGDQPVIKFENVSKRFAFRRDEPQTILEQFASFFTHRHARRKEGDLWAVRDVSFHVMPGQCLGIVGRNGSGKSTVLKLATRILRPTSGRVLVRGRVSALLELGAGFHPDLTGRENIYLNASVLGLTRSEIEATFDEVVAFSELEEFIDMPVKHYSSGMYMRLGFSVAIHVKPDVLIVDEILAVGDQAFQAKCVDKIYDLKGEGTTIIIVSHNLDMMRNLCTHLVWLDHGRVRLSGPVEEVAGQYMAYSHHRQSGQMDLAARNESFRRWGDGAIEITAVRFLNAAGEEQDVFQTGEPMTIEMAYIAHKPVENPEFGLGIYRNDGIHINGPNTRVAGMNLGVVEGPGVVRYHIEKLPLLPAQYRVTTAVHDSKLPLAYDHHELAYSFRVAGGNRELYGIIEMPAHWEHTKSVKIEQQNTISQ
ncbi:MAG: ABC transporter ATP-binding protein [Chloroflexi bacterium]|nr:MAG: ABC transporter ATP-binding protein [Chloroflexota bacterium]